MTYTPTQIDAARAIYKTLLHLERHLAAQPEPDAEALRLTRRFHKQLNRMRQLIAPELPFADFLALIGETPVQSLDDEPDTEGPGAPGKDEPEEPED